MSKLLARLSLLVVSAALLAACASKPARFYTLTPMASAEKGGAGAQPGQVVVSVEPVEIPDYLDRPQIVTRAGQNELKVAEFDRWGGALQDNMSNVLAENLAQLLPSDHVYVNAGTPFEKADYSVALRVVRLDATPGERVLMKAQWKVYSAAAKKGVSQVSQVTEPVAGKGYDAVVAAMNRAINKVSSEIARQIPAGQPAAAATLPERGSR